MSGEGTSLMRPIRVAMILGVLIMIFNRQGESRTFKNPIMNRCMISGLGNILPAFESKLGNWLICVAVTKVGKYAVVYRDRNHRPSLLPEPRTGPKFGTTPMTPMREETEEGLGDDKDRPITRTARWKSPRSSPANNVDSIRRDNRWIRL